MRSTTAALAMIGSLALALGASPAAAQAFPGEPRAFQGAGVFTSQRVYMGPVVGYVDNSVDAPFTFSLTYYNFMGSDTILPGTVRISSPTLFSNDASFTGALAISRSATDATISVINYSTIQYLLLDLDLAAPFPSQSGPVAVLPTSTLAYTGRFFGYSGVVTAFATSFAEPAVPEAASWTMMLLGIGAIGIVARRRQRTGTRPAIA